MTDEEHNRTNICLLELPYDIFIKIMGYLKKSDLRNLMLTCKALHSSILNDDYIWKSNNFIVNNSLDNRSCCTLSAYHKSRISHNWCKGIYRSRIIIQHKVKYMPWLKYHKLKYLLLSVGHELQCYSLPSHKPVDTGKRLWEIKVPTVIRWSVQTNDISRFVIEDDLIACGNRNGCVSVYTVKHMKKKPQLLRYYKDCHKNGLVEVSAVELISNSDTPYVVTSSNIDRLVHFWPIEREHSPAYNTFDTPSQVAQSVDLGEDVGGRCLAVNDRQDRIAVGQRGNSMPVLVDVNTAQKLWSVDSRRDRAELVRDIQWHDDNRVAFVNHRGSLQLLDTRTNQLSYESIDPMESSLYCLKTDGENAAMVGTSEYMRCALFDLRKTKYLQMYFTQKRSSPVYCLDFDSTKLITAADMGVSYLNFNIHVKTAVRHDNSKSCDFVKIP